LTRNAVVNSFHSSSIDYIFEYFPDTVVSLDSHLDTFFFGMTNKLLNAITKMPKKLKDAILRPSTHAMMRRIMPDTEIFLAIPWSSVWSDSVGKYKQALKAVELEEGDLAPKDAVKFQKMFIKKILKMELYTSPPTNLKPLADKVKARDLVIDVDVDYMTEFQGECYTAAPRLEIEGTEVTKLSSIDKVIKFIRLTKPKLITVSEMKLESLRKTNSATNRFLGMLKAIRYDVEYGNLVSSDNEAYSLIKAHEDFVQNKLNKIQQKYFKYDEDMPKWVKKEEDEIANALKEYFKPLAKKIK
jgi:hypothetical protein